MNFSKIVNKGAYTGAGIGADINNFNISRGAMDGHESGSDQEKRQYIIINIGEFAGAGVGASSNKFGDSQSSTNQDPHQIIQKADIPDPDNSLPTYTGEAIGQIQSTVMYGQLIPNSNQTPKPDTFVNFCRDVGHFRWDREPRNWLYLGVKYVGGEMNGNYGFCFYTGKYSQARVHIDGRYKQVEVPFYPTNLASKEKNQGIYYLEGSGYVWGWLYNPRFTPNPVPQPKYNPSFYGPHPKPNSLNPSPNTNSDRIIGNRHGSIPDSSTYVDHCPVSRAGRGGYGHDNFGKEKDNYNGSSNDTNYEDDVGLISDEDTIGSELGNVSGWNYNPSPTPNSVYQPRSNPAFFGPRPRPNFFNPSLNTNSDMIKGNFHGNFPDASTYGDHRPVSHGGCRGYSRDNYGRNKDIYETYSDNDTDYRNDGGLISDEDNIGRDLENLFQINSDDDTEYWNDEGVISAEDYIDRDLENLFQTNNDDDKEYGNDEGLISDEDYICRDLEILFLE